MLDHPLPPHTYHTDGQHTLQSDDPNIIGHALTLGYQPTSGTKWLALHLENIRHHQRPPIVEAIIPLSLREYQRLQRLANEHAVMLDTLSRIRKNQP